MTAGAPELGIAHQNSYLEFYLETYGQYLIEKRLVEGRDMVGMFMTKQPAGEYPDDGVGEYNIQISMAAPLKGKFDLGDGDFESIVRKNDFIVVPPETKAKFELHKEHTVMGIGLPRSYFEAALNDWNIKGFSIDPLMKGVHKDPAIARLAQDAWSEGLSGGDLGALYVDTNILALVSRIVALSTRADEKYQSGRRLDERSFRRIAEYVDSNVDTAIRMKTLANLVHLGEYEFARQFREYTGLPPYQWVIDRRLGKADQLLRDSTLTLAEIAYACGFSSQAHMTSLFSKKRGVTPLELRKNSK